MKKSYKRLLIFQIFFSILLILSSFVSSILGKYRFVIILLVFTLLFKILFGYEKDKYRCKKDIILDTLIFLLIFFFLWYLSGIIFTFSKINSYFTISGIFNFLLPIIIIVTLKELLRYMMIRKAEGSKTLIITTIIVFILFDVFTSEYLVPFSSNYDVFLFLALGLLPAISTNIALSYVTYKVGYKPVLLYSFVTQIYSYIIPIVPNPNEYIISVVQLILPTIYAYRVGNFLKKDRRSIPTQDVAKRRLGSLIFPGLIIAFLVYITSGYFHYYAVAIASGSMTPEIKKGDVVIIEKIDNTKNLQLGQIIAYEYDDILIVHRLVNKLEVNGEDYFYTKGDANEIEDGYPITEDMIVGVVNFKVPYIGLPTVILNEL